MLYPSTLMVAASPTSEVDTADQKVIPSFLRDEAALYRKHIEGLFNESLNQMRWAYDSGAPMFRAVDPPADSSGFALVPDWREFLQAEALPVTAYEVGYLAAPQSRGTLPSVLRDLKETLEKTYGNDIARLNQALGTTFSGWNTLYIRPRNGLERRGAQAECPLDRAIAAFTSRQPLENRYYFSAEGFYKSAFLKVLYGSDLSGYNRAHGTTYPSWDTIHLEQRAPAPDRTSALERDDWERFVRGILNLAWIRATPGAAAGYRNFLRAKYGDIAVYCQRYGTECAGFEQVPFPEQPPAAGVALSDWESYLQGWRHPSTGEFLVMPVDTLVLDTVDFRFRDWLRKKYGTLESLNRHLAASDAKVVAGRSSMASWLSILPPQRAFHYLAFKESTTALRLEFATRNVRSVIDYMARHGRAVLNTALYCGLSVLCALIFNPLAAYALSRYRPRSTYRILLFMMLTMAFPPMVTQIPVFLMLREFNLLNSFAALILPGLANGYTIFLLKGFFDSLPRELYECAQLDGAGEFRLFWQLTLRLSTPVLAVTALGAFTVAYSNFMMALLVCQDERMWTIMPWLYQLQASSGQGVVFASLLMASLPTLLVFTLCQKVIMQGIVVPVEK